MMLGHPFFNPQPEPVNPVFVSDTLFPLAGGAFPVKYGGKKKDAQGRTFAGLTTLNPDTLVNIFKASPNPEQTLMHEAGHMWDARGLAPVVTTGLLGSMNSYQPQTLQEAYYMSAPEEYIAESFKRALQLLRDTKGQPTGETLQAANQAWPGLLEVVQWMLTRAPFAETP